MDVHLTNEFHNTYVRVQVDSLPATLTPAATRYVRHVLCGIEGCTCGTIQGDQEVAWRFVRQPGGQEVLLLEPKS